MTVSNLTLKDVEVASEENGTGYAAAVVGYCEGNAILTNVDVVDATVVGVKSSGMLVGHMSGSLTATNCDVSGTVTLKEFAEEANGHYAGEYVGTVAGNVQLNGCTENVTVSGNLNAANVGAIYGRVVSGSLTVDGVKYVTNSAALKAAIEAKESKVLVANGNYELRFTNNTDFNVDNMKIIGVGDNVTLSISSSEVHYGRIQGDNVTFENIIFTGTTIGATGKATYNNCTIAGKLECASSNQAETYVNNSTVGMFHTSTDFNSGNAYVNNSTITKAEYSGGKTMYFEECEIGELISWNTSTVLTNCTVTTIDASRMTTNAIIVDGKQLVVNEDSFSAALNGDSNEITISMGAGEYKMPSFGGNKEVTIVGTKDTVIDNTMGSYMENSTVSFEGVTIKCSTGMANGNGSDYAALYTPNVTYTNCTFVGPMRVGRDGAKFINCTFTELGNDYVWTYGNDVEFIGCTFKTDGKAILIYSDGGNEVSKVTVKDCKFEATAGAKAGAISNQNCAAIEIHNYGNGVNLVTSGNTIGESFSGEWRIKQYDKGAAIIVNGVTYTKTALDGRLMTVSGTVATLD